MHPGTDRDVAVGWASPVTATVSVRAKVTCVDGNGGNGVSWAIVQLSRSGKNQVLAQGEVGRGDSRAIPADAEAARLATVAVQAGDGLMLAMNRRGGQ